MPAPPPLAAPTAPAVGAARPRHERLSAAEHRRYRRSVALRRDLVGWAFMSPMYLFFVLFLLVPAIGVVWWSTQSGGLIAGSKYVGLDNFTGLPTEPLALTAIRNTLVFAVLSIPPTIV